MPHILALNAGKIEEFTVSSVTLDEQIKEEVLLMKVGARGQGMVVKVTRAKGKGSAHTQVGGFNAATATLNEQIKEEVLLMKVDQGDRGWRW